MVSILVVDDSSVDQQLVAGILRTHRDWRLRFAANGKEALDLIREARPDVILTDLHMPEMDGLELVRSVQSKYPLVPVVLLTAIGNELTAVKALEQGAASYVPKKHLADLLIETVERVLLLACDRGLQKSLLRAMRTMRCSFVLNNEPPLLTTLVQYLQQVIADMQLFTEGERLRVGVALEEALLNAAYHGNLEVSSKLREIDHSAYYELARQRSKMAPYAERRVYVDVEVSVDGVKYTIRDEGRGFDPRIQPDPTDPEFIERPCGRGMLLMRTFMDSVDYNDMGNQVTLSKGTSRVCMAQ